MERLGRRLRGVGGRGKGEGGEFSKGAVAQEDSPRLNISRPLDMFRQCLQCNVFSFLSSIYLYYCTGFIY